MEKLFIALAAIIDIAGIIAIACFMIINHTMYIPFMLLECGMIYALVETVKTFVKNF